MDADRDLAAGFVAALVAFAAGVFVAALAVAFGSALALDFGADFAAAVDVSAAAAALAAVLVVAFDGRLPLAPDFVAMDVSSLTVTEHRSTSCGINRLARSRDRAARPSARVVAMTPMMAAT